MARRTATVVKLSYWKKYARGDDKALNLAELPDGSDFLHFAHAVWRGLQPNTLQDRAHQRYCEPASSYPRGRAFVATARVGNYGDPASVRHVETGEERLRHDGELANSIDLRIAIVVPTRGTVALAFIEHVSGLVFGQRFLDHLEAAWGQKFPAYVLNRQTLTRPDAWIESASLSEVVAETFKHPVNLEDVGQPGTVGRLRSVILPPRGQRYLPTKLWEKLRGGGVDRAALLGLPEEPDEVAVKLGDGDQEKTFVIGNERTPPVRHLLTDYGVTQYSEHALLRWALAETQPIAAIVGGDWQTHGSSIDEEWDAEALQLKVVVNDEQQGRPE